jgi:hypothetical protein
MAMVALCFRAGRRRPPPMRSLCKTVLNAFVHHIPEHQYPWFWMSGVSGGKVCEHERRLENDMEKNDTKNK